MRSPERTSDLKILIVGGVAMLALTGLSFLAAPPDNAPRETGSSYAPGPDGAKAAFLLLRELGHDVERSFEPFATLHADPSRTLLLLTDPTRQSSEQDRAALLRFVDAGGTVVAAGATAAPFLPGLTEREIREESGEPRTYVAAFPSPLARHVTSIQMSPPPRRIHPDYAVWIQVFADSADPGVLTARRGTGRLIWWASSGPLSNAAIHEPGHLDLLLNAVGPPRARRILWDEYYHGHARSLWSYASGTPVAWSLAQLGLIAAVALFTFGRYVGPPRSRVVVPRTSPLEFVDTMGGLYERAHTAGAAVATARAYVRRRLLARAGIPASSTDERLASVLASRFGVDGPEVRALLERSEVPDPPVKEADAVLLVQQLQRLAADIAGSGAAGRRRSA
jgi:Domain of unknown function (DUF4350)